MRISRSLRRSATLFAALAATVAVSACGSSGSTPKAAIAPPSRLVAAGHLTYCSDMEYPAEISRPFGKPVGYDADVGIRVANEFGLTPVFVQTPFASIFTTLDASKCDAIINSVTITPQRQPAFYMIPYGQYGITILVRKGNPKHITTVVSICAV